MRSRRARVQSGALHRESLGGLRGYYSRREMRGNGAQHEKAQAQHGSLRANTLTRPPAFADGKNPIWTRFQRRHSSFHTHSECDVHTAQYPSYLSPPVTLQLVMFQRPPLDLNSARKLTNSDRDRPKRSST